MYVRVFEGMISRLVRRECFVGDVIAWDNKDSLMRRLQRCN